MLHTSTALCKPSQLETKGFSQMLYIINIPVANASVTELAGRMHESGICITDPPPRSLRAGTAAKQSPGVIRWADEDQMERELSAATLEPARGMVTLRSGSSKKKLWGKVRDHFHLRNKAVATARPGADAATRARSSSYHSPKSAEDRDLILRGLRT